MTFLKDPLTLSKTPPNDISLTRISLSLSLSLSLGGANGIPRGRAYLHALYGILRLVRLVEQLRIFHVLGQTLEERQRLVERYGHGDFAQLLPDALLQHRPQTDVLLAHRLPLPSNTMQCISSPFLIAMNYDKELVP